MGSAEKAGPQRIEFRIAELKDAPTLTTTRQKVWDATYRGIYPDERIDDYAFSDHLARDEKRIADPRNKVWLALDGAACIGYLYIGPCSYGSYKDFELCLNSLYFMPPYQGMGLGRKAIELTASECARRGYDKFFCGCNAHNHKARSFYEHMGGRLGQESLGHSSKAEDQVYYEFYLNPQQRRIP